MKHVLHMLSLGQVQYPLREWVRSPLPSPTSGKGELQTQNPEPASGHHYPTIVGPPLRPSVSPPPREASMGLLCRLGEGLDKVGHVGPSSVPTALGARSPRVMKDWRDPVGRPSGAYLLW